MFEQKMKMSVNGYLFEHRVHFSDKSIMIFMKPN